MSIAHTWAGHQTPFSDSGKEGEEGKREEGTVVFLRHAYLWPWEQRPPGHLPLLHTHPLHGLLLQTNLPCPFCGSLLGWKGGHAFPRIRSHGSRMRHSRQTGSRLLFSGRATTETLHKTLGRRIPHLWEEEGQIGCLLTFPQKQNKYKKSLMVIEWPYQGLKAWTRHTPLCALPGSGAEALSTPMHT